MLVDIALQPGHHHACNPTDDRPSGSGSAPITTSQIDGFHTCSTLPDASETISGDHNVVPLPTNVCPSTPLNMIANSASDWQG